MLSSFFSFSSPGPTVCGVLVIILGVVLLPFGEEGTWARADTLITAGVAIVGGAGIAMSRQNNKSSEDVGVK